MIPRPVLDGDTIQLGKGSSVIAVPILFMVQRKCIDQVTTLPANLRLYEQIEILTHGYIYNESCVVTTLSRDSS